MAGKGFMDKNKEHGNMELYILLSRSKCPFVANLIDMLKEQHTPGTLRRNSSADMHMHPNSSAVMGMRDSPSRSVSQKNKKRLSQSLVRRPLATQFRRQMDELLHRLGEMKPYYIRCIKPNDNHSPTKFDNNRVRHQLHCSACFEAIRIRQTGFPYRRQHQWFGSRFRHLVRGSGKVERAGAERARIQTLLRNIEENVHALKYQAKARLRIHYHADQADNCDFIVEQLQAIVVGNT
jgi:myosin heavy subunit